MLGDVNAREKRSGIIRGSLDVFLHDYETDDDNNTRCLR